MISLITILIIFLALLLLAGNSIHSPGLYTTIAEASSEVSYSSHSRAKADSEYSFTITCNNNTHVTNGNDPTGYYIEVKNTGTKQDSLLITYKIINVTGGSEPDINEWHANLNRDSVTLNPGDTETLVLTVESGCGCQEGTIATVRVTAQSGNEPTIIAYLDTFTTRGYVVGRLVDFDIADVSVFFELVAGQNLTYELAIYNFQTVSQSYKLINDLKPDGWVLEYDQESIEVNANSKKRVKIHTKIPEENEPGKYSFAFKIKSDRDPTIHDYLWVNLTLNPELAVEKIVPSTVMPKPNESVYLMVNISNLGPAVGRSFKVHLYDGEFNSNNLNENLINFTTITELYGGEETTLNFTWYPESTGLYNISVYVNPYSSPAEAFNRYGNNILKEPITIQEFIPPKNPKKKGDDDKWLYYQIAIGVSVITLLVVILIMYIFRNSASTSDERTALKIPLSRGLSSGPGGAKGRPGDRGASRKKKAHKEKLTAKDKKRSKDKR